MGREAQAPLSEHTDMPWNTYAVSSRKGSARPAPSATGASSSAGGPGTFDIAPPSKSRRISRLISESPLERRQFGLPSRTDSFVMQEEADAEDGGDDFDMEDLDLDRRLAGNLDEDFELYGPAAAVSTQEAASSQWLAATLEQEAFNFFSFIKTTIYDKEDDQPGTDTRDRSTTTFEELLPSEKNTNVVAAQGFLHVLSLATKGLIRVRQTEDFGDIVLSIAGSYSSQAPQVAVEA